MAKAKDIEEVEKALKEWKKQGRLNVFELERLIEARLDMAKDQIMQGNFRNARQLLEEAVEFGKERMIALLGEEKAKKIWLE